MTAPEIAKRDARLRLWRAERQLAEHHAIINNGRGCSYCTLYELNVKAARHTLNALDAVKEP